MSRLHGDSLGAPIGAVPMPGSRFSPYGATGALTPWTPAIVQGVSVTSTVVTSTYFQIGRTVWYQCVLSVTGAGTAANVITVSLPVTANSASIHSELGTGHITDTSAVLRYTAQVVIATTTTVKFHQQTTTVGIAEPTYLGLGASAFALALANTDVVAFSGWYEAALDV